MCRSAAGERIPFVMNAVSWAMSGKLFAITAQNPSYRSALMSGARVSARLSGSVVSTSTRGRCMHCRVLPMYSAASRPPAR